MMPYIGASADTAYLKPLESVRLRWLRVEC